MEQIHSLDFGDAPKFILDRLVHEKGLGRHGFFFTTDEGEAAPDGSGVSSGFVINEDAKTYFFVVDWAAQMRDAILVEWEEVETDHSLAKSAEYRRALAKAGLSLPV